MLDHVRTLFDQQLYSDVVHLADLVLPSLSSTCATSASSDSCFSSPTARFRLLVYQAHSLHRIQEYRRCELFCRRALQLNKSLNKSRPRPGSESATSTITTSQSSQSADPGSEPELRYLLHECLAAQRQHQQAVCVLEAVPARHRSPRINMALGRLYERLGTERSAVAAYKEVLRQCPLAVDAARALLALGVRGTEVGALMVHAGADWVPVWLRVQAQLSSGEFDSCASSVRAVEVSSPLYASRGLHVLAGTALYCAGDSAGALLALQRAHAQEPHAAGGTDLLAALYFEQERRDELARLAQLATPACAVMGSHATPQPWLVLGYHAAATRHHLRALYFAHRAMSLSPRCVEALLLKALLMHRLKQSEQAAVHYREAMQLAPTRFEPLRGLVHCYVHMGRHKEAAALANGALKTPAGQTARTLTLCARVLSHEPMYAARVRPMLERALTLNQHFLPAALLLSRHYEKSGYGESALEVLRRQLHVHGNSCRLQLAVGGVLARTGQNTATALHHFRAALALQPDNVHALRVLAQLEADPSSVTSVDDPVSDPESDGDPSTAADPDTDNELAEASWADMEFSFGT